VDLGSMQKPRVCGRSWAGSTGEFAETGRVCLSCKYRTKAK
jgi:hypothetical protein